MDDRLGDGIAACTGEKQVELMQTMTPRERVEAVLGKRQADRVPFTSYPGEIPGKPCLDRLLDQGLCLVRRMSGVKAVTRDVKQTVEEFTDPEDGVRKRRTVVETPVGTATAVGAYAQDGVCPVEPFFKSPEDYKVLRFWVENRQFTEAYDQVLDAMADSTPSEVFRGTVGGEPLQKVITMMGVVNFSMEWLDNRDEVMNLYNACLEEARRQYPLVAKAPLWHMNCGGNCVPEIIGLERFKQLYVPFYNEVSEYMHRHDKLVGTHLDANNRLWAKEVGETELDYIEAFTPPPGGDLSVGEALEAWPGKVLWLNFPSSVHRRGAEHVRRVLLDILHQAGSGERLIMGITETVPPEIAAETFPLLGALLMEHGKLPLSQES